MDTANFVWILQNHDDDAGIQNGHPCALCGLQCVDQPFNNNLEGILNFFTFSTNGFGLRCSPCQREAPRATFASVLSTLNPLDKPINETLAARFSDVPFNLHVDFPNDVVKIANTCPQIMIYKRVLRSGEVHTDGRYSNLIGIPTFRPLRKETCLYLFLVRYHHGIMLFEWHGIPAHGAHVVGKCTGRISYLAQKSFRSHGQVITIEPLPEFEGVPVVAPLAVTRLALDKYSKRRKLDRNGEHNSTCQQYLLRRL